MDGNKGGFVGKADFLAQGFAYFHEFIIGHGILLSVTVYAENEEQANIFYDICNIWQSAPHPRAVYKAEAGYGASFMAVGTGTGGVYRVSGIDSLKADIGDIEDLLDGLKAKLEASGL
jgi:hypothetical protein